jgi:leucyl-tRNA synthetase/predicted alpha/beta hydrolase family esterase
LDKDLDDVNFLEKIKIQQRNWIGRSEGAEIEFRIKNQESRIKVFTTRPDTLFGVTYVVLAPEHEFISKIKNQNEKSQFKIENWEEVNKYIEESRKKTEMERTEAGKEKTGVELKGIKAINPANGEEVPVWIADYVLADYGTGAVMAVPAHDERDFEFAKKYNLSRKNVILPAQVGVVSFHSVDQKIDTTAIINEKETSILNAEEVYVGSGQMRNSGNFEGMDNEEAKWKITETVGGKKITKFKLRDWVFSRQHYWGEPIPVVFCDSCAKRKYKVIVIHGFRSDSKKWWIPWIKGQLEKLGHTVEIPDLPNPEEPSVEEQADFVIKNFKIDKDTILVGHSLGGAVTLRILEKIKIKVARAIFVDPAIRPKFNDKERAPLLKAHSWKFDFKNIKKKASHFTVLADADYFTIPKDQLDELASALDADYITSKPNLAHYKNEKEPEILKIFENFGYVPVPEKDLPIKLPNVEKYQPTDTGESPLASMSKWVNTKCPECGGHARRETDTMPNWAGSSWYYLRYLDPKNKKALVDPKKLNYWSDVSSDLAPSAYNLKPAPVDWYNGGMEHTTLHLLYSRFWHKFLFDIGVVPTHEPYNKRTSHGLVLAEGGVKMSKSKGNVINPDKIVETFGADSLRVYEMFMGPFDQAIAWSTDGLVGVRRFLEKVWRVGERIKNKELRIKGENQKINLENLVHKTVKKVGEDIESMRFNTAISSMMICANEMDSMESVPKELFELYLKILSPFAPHIAEELWSQMGNKNLIAEEKWPTYDPKKIIDEEVSVIVQVNGKVRGQFKASPDISEEEAIGMAKLLPDVKKWLDGKEIKKSFFVKGRLINLVV